MSAPPLLLHAFASFAVGGPQVRFATLANRLGGAFRHAVVAMDGKLDARALLDPSLDVRFPEITVAKGDTLGNLRRFRAALGEIRPDLLVTSNWGSIEWALARIGTGIPHLHMEDGFGPEERVRQIPRRVLARRLLLRHATVVVPSRVLWRIAREVWRLPQRRLRLLPNGIDLGRFTSVDRPRDTGEVVIGTVAALRPEKNLARLIRAVGRLGPELRLVIVGGGGERPALEALVADKGMAARVTFAGHQTDPAPLYAGFDIFALSSDTEQMPLSVLEAMAAALPVAATDVGDVAEMLAPENRPFVVPCHDAALADALDALARDAKARRNIGAANRRRAEEDFNEAGMVAAWGELFRDLSARR
ncbi:glycosyltransferase [Roseomonas sp. HJA6]|uniref:Glycosyltransferase n=1 Tax=Roseomonas alba TaxID=2846776 RepID=A0ABS7A5H1_9PROT|nr:glycosyltransferase [Neoroseomonas alba]MBW6397543.1 glycosyltransferase [Neoroseomonas alba]